MTDRPDQLDGTATVSPPATSADHVLVLPNQTTEAPDAAAILKKQGSTAHFEVFYEDGLGANGPALAKAVLETAESDFAALQGWFGGITPSSMPFVVNIVPGSGGASHANCAATTLNCDAFGGTDSDLVRMLVVAEADEVFMAAQNKGWNCGASNGEGLSRVLATERYPAQLNGFASASSWLNSSRPDFVTNTDPTDRNYVSIGCATLFINYLRHQLGFGLDAIVQAAGATLEDTYHTLTGLNNGFARFSALLSQNFPPGTAVNLADDNPFPLPTWGELYTNADSLLTLDVARNADGRLEVFGINQAGRIWHTWQTKPNNGWAGSWAELYTDADSLVTLDAARNQDGRIEVFGINQAGRIFHTWQTQPNNGWVGP
jgi:hypothetical protein